MNDPIYRAFLEAQYTEAMALAAASDILDLEPLGAAPYQRYRAQYHCKGLYLASSGEIQETDHFALGIYFPDNYLRIPECKQNITILAPRTIWHPNAVGPFLCPGHLPGGTPLTDIAYQLYEIITYQRWASHDGLYAPACEWARNNQHRLPVDRRPLKWKEARS